MAKKAPVSKTRQRTRESSEVVAGRYLNIRKVVVLCCEPVGKSVTIDLPEPKHLNVVHSPSEALLTLKEAALGGAAKQVSGALSPVSEVHLLCCEPMRSTLTTIPSSSAVTVSQSAGALLITERQS